MQEKKIPLQKTFFQRYQGSWKCFLGKLGAGFFTDCLVSSSFDHRMEAIWPPFNFLWRLASNAWYALPPSIGMAKQYQIPINNLDIKRYLIGDFFKLWIEHINRQRRFFILNALCMYLLYNFGLKLYKRSFWQLSHWYALESKLSEY